ncbi:MAG: ABC transporter ATP-binding protein [Acholeplasmataceae bacterium]
MRTVKLFRIAKGFYFVFFITALLTIIHQFTYSNVPLFTQYLIKTLLAQPGVADTSVNVGEVNLPIFIIRFLTVDQEVLNIVLRIVISLLLLQLFRFTLRFFELWLKGYLLEGTAENLRKKMFSHIQDLNFEFHNNADTGDLIQRSTTDIETTTFFLSTSLLDFIYLIATLFFGAYQLYFISPTMVWLSLSLTPLIAASSIIYFLKIDKLFKNIEEAESAMMTVVQENLSGSRVVRAFGNEPFEIEKMNVKNETYRDALIKANKISAVYWGSMDFVAFMQYLLVIGIGIFNVRNQTMDAAGVIASLALVGMLIWPLRMLGRIINSYGKALVASDRIYEILEKPSEYEIDGTLTPEIKGRIEFKDVSFKFNETSEHLLKKVNFIIEAGETVALIGRTGSGKSTIINLLLRMHEYQEGDILIDDTPLKDIAKKHIRSHTGVVLQDPFLYSKTVYENITIGHAYLQKDQVVKAAQIAALEKDINSFKKGYDTVVGEKGTTLSGGQKQRVAIARVLVHQKPILIFDDALSAVDTETDAMIRRALLAKDQRHTTIIITHRITTAKEADKIIILDQGAIQAIGTHEELSKQPGLYKTLWDIQGELEASFFETAKGGDTDAT